MLAMTAVQPTGQSAALGFRSLQRRLAALRPGTDLPSGDEAPLEPLPVPGEAPRLIRASPLEGGSVRAHRVFGAPEVGFDAFLDGTQSSQTLAFAGGVAVIYGTVAAVVRLRRNRRMTTWATPSAW